MAESVTCAETHDPHLEKGMKKPRGSMSRSNRHLRGDHGLGRAELATALLKVQSDWEGCFLRQLLSQERPKHLSHDLGHGFRKGNETPHRLLATAEHGSVEHRRVHYDHQHQQPSDCVVVHGWNLLRGVTHTHRGAGIKKAGKTRLARRTRRSAPLTALIENPRLCSPKFLTCEQWSV